MTASEGRATYADAGKALRQAVLALPPEATGMEAKVLLALAAKVSSWSRVEENVYLAEIADLIYNTTDGDDAKKVEITRTHTTRVGKALRSLADRGVIHLERPGVGRPPTDRRPYYRVHMDRNAALTSRVLKNLGGNAARKSAERGPTGPRNAAPQGYPSEKNEKYSEGTKRGPTEPRYVRRLITAAGGHDVSKILAQCSAIEEHLLHTYDESVLALAVAQLEQSSFNAYGGLSDRDVRTIEDKCQSIVDGIAAAGPPDDINQEATSAKA